jgi:NADH:ubiquinone oxidoreductase subunit 2 (subunit N)
VKRMLAYSSIAHAGHALLGLVADPRAGGAAWLLACIATALVGTLFLGIFPGGSMQLTAASFGSSP